MRPPSAKAKAAVRAMLSHIDSDPLQQRAQSAAVLWHILRMNYHFPDQDDVEMPGEITANNRFICIVRYNSSGYVSCSASMKGTSSPPSSKHSPQHPHGLLPVWSSET